MRLKTICLEGEITGDTIKHTFTYSLGDVESISMGRWEFAISSIAYNIGQETAWNSIFQLSSNYIDTTVPTQTGTVKKEMPLGLIRLKGAPKEKVVIGYKWRDFFTVTSPSRSFNLNWTEIFRDTEVPRKKRTAKIQILILFRRVA